MLPEISAMFVKAVASAREAGATEVGVDDLINALTPDPTRSQSSNEAPPGGLAPAPHYDVRFSSAAAAALASAGDLHSLTVDQLMAALLRVKNRS